MRADGAEEDLIRFICICIWLSRHTIDAVLRFFAFLEPPITATSAQRNSTHYFPFIDL